MDQPFRQMTDVLMRDLRDANEIDNRYVKLLVQNFTTRWYPSFVL